MPNKIHAGIVLEAVSHASDTMKKTVRDTDTVTKSLKALENQMTAVNKIPKKIDTTPYVSPIETAVRSGAFGSRPPPLAPSDTSPRWFESDLPKQTASLEKYKETLDEVWNSFSNKIPAAISTSNEHLSLLTKHLNVVTDAASGGKTKEDFAKSAQGFFGIAEAAKEAQNRIGVFGAQLQRSGAGQDIIDSMAKRWHAYGKVVTEATKQGSLASEAASILPSNLQKQAGVLDQLQGAWVRMAAQFYLAQQAIQGIIGAAQKFIELGRLGAEARQVEKSFASMTQSVGLTKDLLNELREASGGTISDLRLMQAAQTSLVGVSEEFGNKLGEALPRLVQIARAAHQANPALGSTDHLFNSLTIGLKRLSPRLIDNTGLQIRLGQANAKLAAQLGKSTDALTAEEQQQALLNATLEAGDRLIEQVGGSAESLVDPFDRFDTAVANLNERLGKEFRVAATMFVEGATNIFNVINQGLSLPEQMANAFIEHNNAMKKSAATYAEYSQEVYRAADAANLYVNEYGQVFQLQRDLVTGTTQWVKISQIATQLDFDRREGLRRLNEAAEQRKSALDYAIAQEEKYAEAVRRVKDAINALAGDFQNLSRQNFGNFIIEAMKGFGATQREIDVMRLSFGLIDRDMLKFQERLRQIRPGDIEAYRQLFAAFKQETGAKAINEATGSLQMFANQLKFGQITPDAFLKNLDVIRDRLNKFASEGVISSEVAKNFDKFAAEMTMGSEVVKEALDNLNRAKENLKKLQDDMVKIDRDFAIRQQEIIAKREESIADVEEKAREKEIDDNKAHAKKLEKLAVDMNKRLEQIQKRFEQARFRALIDRDARALAEAEETYNGERQEAAENYQEAKDEAAQEREDRRQELLDEQADRISDIQRQAKREIDQARVKYYQERNENYAQQLELQRILNGGLTGQYQIIVQRMREQQLAYQVAYYQMQNDLIQHYLRMNTITSAMTGGGGSSSTGGAASGDTNQRFGGGGRGQQMFQFGGLVPGPPSQGRQITAHGGEFVVPSQLVPALQRLASGQMRATIEIRGEGELARLVRSAVYDAVIEIVS